MDMAAVMPDLDQVRLRGGVVTQGNGFIDQSGIDFIDQAV